MRLVITQNITLDGVIDATEGWFTASEGEDDDQADVLAELQRQTAEEDALLVGRTTFEQFRGYWPQQTDDTTGITEHLNRVPKYVVSTTLTDPGWENTTVLSGDLPTEVLALKAAEGRDCTVTGSIGLVHALVTMDVVDEYRLFVYPVVLGRGARLFEDPAAAAKLRLLEAKPFRSGIALLRYAPA